MQNRTRIKRFFVRRGYGLLGEGGALALFLIFALVLVSAVVVRMEGYALPGWALGVLAAAFALLGAVFLWSIRYDGGGDTIGGSNNDIGGGPTGCGDGDGGHV